MSDFRCLFFGGIVVCLYLTFVFRLAVSLVLTVSLVLARVFRAAVFVPINETTMVSSLDRVSTTVVYIVV